MRPLIPILCLLLTSVQVGVAQAPTMDRVYEVRTEEAAIADDLGERHAPLQALVTRAVAVADRWQAVRAGTAPDGEDTERFLVSRVAELLDEAQRLVPHTAVTSHLRWLLEIAIMDVDEAQYATPQEETP